MRPAAGLNHYWILVFKVVSSVKAFAFRFVIAVALSMLSVGGSAAGNWSHGGYGARRQPQSQGPHGRQASPDRDRYHGRGDRDRRPRYYGHRGFRGYDGFSGNFGLYFGSPFYPDPFYWNSYPYQPPAYYVPAQPRIYIQQNQQQPYYWYWCANPQGYYPYIKSCPQPWQQIVPYGTPPR